MQQRNNIRFLKKITILSVVMNIIITVASLILFFIIGEMSAGHLSALLGAWSIELALSAYIKSNEVKQEKQKQPTDINNSI